MSEAQDRRVAVVTGANRGIGLEVARELAKKGYEVVLTGRSLKKAQGAAASVGDEGVTPAQLDVSSDASVDAFFGFISERFGRIDVLVNNAGAIFERDEHGGTPSIFELPADTMSQALNTNAIGAYRTMQRALPMMNERGYGRVVNVSSGMGALHGMGSGHPAYRTSKTAMSALTILFAHEAHGDVKVNAVCPGWVRTDMGGAHATRSVEEGAAGIVWAATLASDGPSGGFFRDGEPIEW